MRWAGLAWLLAPPAWQHVRRSASFEEDVHLLAASTLAMLEDDMASARAVFTRSSRSEVVDRVFGEVTRGDKLSEVEALVFFEKLATEVVRELATTDGAAGTHARSLVHAEDGGAMSAACAQIAAQLWALADESGDGTLTKKDLARTFDAIRSDEHPLDSILGSLQLLPPHLRAVEDYEGESWHADTPGDARVLKRWRARDFSIVGIGRSADASAYYLPELDVVLDAGLSVKSIEPKVVLLTHGHRDHTQALPALARKAKFGGAKRANAKIVLPREIETLARRFVQAEAVLNLGRHQSDDENDAALGALDFAPVAPGDDLDLSVASRDLGVRVYRATHKPGVPSVAYGLYRRKRRLKPEFAGASPEYIKAHREDCIQVYRDAMLFYSGDTTIDMILGNPAILEEYPYVIHECTFLGDPDDPNLERTCAATGHTHYAQLFPLVCAHPATTFVLVHFSTRYTKQDVLGFFERAYGGLPQNVVLWI